MALPGETVGTGAPLPHEGAEPQVVRSAAGYFIGYSDLEGFPYTRESIEYYPTHEEALEALITQKWTAR